MSYKVPLATTTDFGIVKIGSGLSVTNGTVSAAATVMNYGFFTSTTTQTNPVANAINLITYDTTGPINGISVVGGNAITVVNAGTYTKMFAVMTDNTASGTHIISFWLRLNGVDVVGSRQDLEVLNTASLSFTSDNFTLAIPAGGNIQMCWSSADNTAILIALPVAVIPTRPTGFSVKLTLTRIG
jgi:hypothetical protein